jgi:hypothetical protein
MATIPAADLAYLNAKLHPGVELSKIKRQEHPPPKTPPPVEDDYEGISKEDPETLIADYFAIFKKNLGKKFDYTEPILLADALLKFLDATKGTSLRGRFGTVDDRKYRGPGLFIRAMSMSPEKRKALLESWYKEDWDLFLNLGGFLVIGVGLVGFYREKQRL